MKKLIAIAFFVVFATTAAFAKSSNPYKDVTPRRVDASSYAAIIYVKQHNGWKDLAKKGMLYPNRYVTRREFMVVLYNLYGEKVPANILDVKSANTGISSGFACSKMVELSSALGYKIQWKGNNTRMRRKDVARYIRIFATYNPKLAPLK